MYTRIAKPATIKLAIEAAERQLHEFKTCHHDDFIFIHGKRSSKKLEYAAQQELIATLEALIK